MLSARRDDGPIDRGRAAPGKNGPWTGVGKDQARNYMRDEMKGGDCVLFYHSSCPEPGIAGIAEVASSVYPDATQFDRKSKYYDAASKQDDPRWLHVDVRAKRKTRLIPLAELRDQKALKDMVTLRRGNRLSITPVGEAEWTFITHKLLKP